MRTTSICAAFLLYSMPFAADERAALGIFTVPDSASVFLDGNPEKEIQRTPFENSAMLPGEHSVLLVSQSESFAPAYYDFVLQPGSALEIDHEFLRRNQVFGAYSLSPSEYHIELNSGFSYVYDGDSKIPFDFRLGLPLGFGAKLAFPVQEREVKNFLLGLQYNYLPLNFGIAADWISPRGSGYSAIKVALLAEQNIWILNSLENLIYEYSKQDDVDFYLRVGMPIQRVFMPYIALRKNSLEPGALLQTGNRVSLEIAIPLTLDKTFGFYFGVHADFAFGKKAKKEDRIIWDVNEVSNRELRGLNDDYPARSVSLKEAMAYSKRVNKRLPTAQEWKRAATAYRNFDDACKNPKLKKTDEGRVVNGMRNFAGNAAVWLLPENENASVAKFAGSSYGDSPEACERKAALTDISSQNGSEYIGIRLVKDISIFP